MHLPGSIVGNIPLPQSPWTPEIINTRSGYKHCADLLLFSAEHPMISLCQRMGTISSSLRKWSSAYEPGPQMHPQWSPRLHSLPPMRIVFYIFFLLCKKKKVHFKHWDSPRVTAVKCPIHGHLRMSCHVQLTQNSWRIHLINSAAFPY